MNRCWCWGQPPPPKGCHVCGRGASPDGFRAIWAKRDAERQAWIDEHMRRHHPELAPTPGWVWASALAFIVFIFIVIPAMMGQLDTSSVPWRR